MHQFLSRRVLVSPSDRVTAVIFADDEEAVTIIRNKKPDPRLIQDLLAVDPSARAWKGMEDRDGSPSLKAGLKTAYECLQVRSHDRSYLIYTTTPSLTQPLTHSLTHRKSFSSHMNKKHTGLPLSSFHPLSDLWSKSWSIPRLSLLSYLVFLFSCPLWWMSTFGRKDISMSSMYGTLFSR